MLSATGNKFHSRLACYIHYMLGARAAQSTEPFLSLKSENPPDDGPVLSPLLPLHYPVLEDTICYGQSYYHTDCRRFRIIKHKIYDARDWRIEAVGPSSPWIEWLLERGLAFAPFQTRKAALHALYAALAADDKLTLILGQ